MTACDASPSGKTDPDIHAPRATISARGSFTESAVEDAALASLESLGYAVLRGLDIAAGELTTERTLAALRDALLPKLISGEIRVTLPEEVPT